MGEADQEARAKEAMRAKLPPIAALVERYQQAVGSYLLHLIGDVERAARLAEETFVQAHRAGLTDAPAAAAQVWLYRIATRLGMAELNAGQSRDVRNQETDFVRRALAALEPEQRAMLLLADKQGLSEAEVAAILDHRAEHVHRDLEQARARFRQLCVRQHALTDRRSNGVHAFGGSPGRGGPARRSS